MKKSWTKSKSQSLGSKRSTPERAPLATAFTAVKNARIACASILMACFSLALSACYVPPNAPVEKTSAVPPVQVPESREMTHTLTIQTPTPGWTLSPTSLFSVGEGTYLCIHQLTAPQGMVAQMISQTSDRVIFDREDFAQVLVQDYVLGKTWNWDGNPDVTFIDSIDELKDALAEAQSVPFTTE